MYIRTIDTPIFPYDPVQLRLDHPNVSFPVEFTEEILNEYGVFKVQYEEAPIIDQRTQYIEYEKSPTFMNNNWVIRCMVMSKDQTAIDAYDAYVGKSITNKRNALLAETDWIIVKAIENSEAVPTEWQMYRQALRDITIQPGFPYDVTWPTQPGVN